MIKKSNKDKNNMNTVCPRNLDPIHIVTYYIGQDFSDRQYTPGLEYIIMHFLVGRPGTEAQSTFSYLKNSHLL